MSILTSVLKRFSGNREYIVSDQLLYDKIIGFRGVVAGVGTSTIVQNTAIALSELTNYTICVVDTSFLYPTQYPMLISKKEDARPDLLDFDKELSGVALKTNYPNITLMSMSARNITDMLSTADSEKTVEKLFGVLKSYFDVILVDLSQEMTNITTHSAVKCNRIFNIADQSLKSVYHLKKSINLMATLAVPIAKANVVVVNKVLPDIITNTQSVLEGAGMKVIAEIPHSIEIAKLGVTGKPVFAKKTTNRDIHEFSSSIITIVENLLSLTPKNAKRLNKGMKLEETATSEETLPTEIASSTSNNVFKEGTLGADNKQDDGISEYDVDLFDSAEDIEEEVIVQALPVKEVAVKQETVYPPVEKEDADLKMVSLVDVSEEQEEVVDSLAPSENSVEVIK